MNRFAGRFLIWIVSFAVFPIPASLLVRSFQVEVLQRITLAAAALPQEPVRVELTDRVLVRLEKSEKKEIDPWVRDDIRIAWITTKWAQYGVPEWSWHRNSSPHVAATYQVLHCHPDEVWPRIVARRQQMLKAEYVNFFPPGASSPKKPCVSVRTPRRQRVA